MFEDCNCGLESESEYGSEDEEEMEKNLQMRQQYCFKTANVEFEMDKPATHNSFEHNFNEFNRRHKIPVFKTEYHRDFEGNRIPASFF